MPMVPPLLTFDGGAGNDIVVGGRGNDVAFPGPVVPAIEPGRPGRAPAGLATEEVIMRKDRFDAPYCF